MCLLSAELRSPTRGLTVLGMNHAPRVSPVFVEPMLSLAVAKLPEGPEWRYELKFDGYRSLGLKTDGRAQLLSRNGKDFTARFVSIARALEALPDETVIDGEIVAYDADGRPSFNVLQNHLGDRPLLHFYAFDLLALRAKDLTEEPLEERRGLLRRKVIPLLPDSIRYSETLEASAADVVDAVRRQGLEGVVAKRRHCLYEPGKRSGALAEDAHQQSARVFDRRLHPGAAQLRCTPGRLL
jgi:ATP-dependent DNA ligase